MTDNTINFYILEYLIKVFNEDISSEDIEYINDIDCFISYNSEYLFHAIDNINYYIEKYNELSKLELKNCSVISNNLYNDVLIDLILSMKKRDKAILDNILYTQRCLLERLLLKVKNLLVLLLRCDDDLIELVEKFNIILRYDYNLRRKYVKIRMLTR